MHRRHLLTLPLLAALPAFADAATTVPGLHAGTVVPELRAGTVVPELRAGVAPDRAARLARRLGVPVRSVQAGLVAALNAGHLEVALLDDAELAAARLCMRERLLVLPGRIAGRVPVTRRVLPPGLRQDMAAALA
ncbi:MAG: hypothetical protein ACRYGM_00820 [Janthinobacterium lividum]